MYTIKPTITMVFIFFLYLLFPGISASDNQTTDSQNKEHYLQPAVNPANTVLETKKPSKRKDSLSADRELGGFFTIGLIINVIMIITFFVWALGQWRKKSANTKHAQK